MGGVATPSNILPECSKLNFVLLYSPSVLYCRDNQVDAKRFSCKRKKWDPFCYIELYFFPTGSISKTDHSGRALWYVLLIEPFGNDLKKCNIQVQMMARVVEGNGIAQNLAIWGC